MSHECLVQSEAPNESEIIQPAQVAPPGAPPGAHGSVMPYYSIQQQEGSAGNSEVCPGYEELFKGSVPCPSCRGSGRIPKEQEQRLVALIPLDDERLRPRRTLLYVFLAVVICAIVAALLLFFLVPRTILMTTSKGHLDPTYTYVNTTEKFVQLTVINEYNISNKNYFPIYLVKLQVSALYDDKKVGQSENDTKIFIPLRSRKRHSTETNVTFKGDEGYIAEVCSRSSIFTHTLLMPFQALTTESLSYSSIHGTFRRY